MKEAPRGPFSRIRWFCNDGTIFPPRPYSCGDHGGGVQHGERSERTQILRDQGYSIANILADIKPEEFVLEKEHDSIMKQILLEQFLILADDGWILRKARYYRGALQAETEARVGRKLLEEMVKKQVWRQDRFPVLRESARLLPGTDGRDKMHSLVRQQALDFAKEDPDFEPIRIKIHVKPEASDAELVLKHIDKAKPELQGTYMQFAQSINSLYSSVDPIGEINSFVEKLPDATLRKKLQKSAELFQTDSPGTRFGAASELLATVRNGLEKNSDRGLDLLNLSLVLERELFVQSEKLGKNIHTVSPLERLELLSHSISSLYGLGFLSKRQQQALQETISELLLVKSIKASQLREKLNYLAHASFWCQRTLAFHFQEIVSRWSAIEPLSKTYIDDRLHASPLNFYAHVLDSLLEESDKVLGIEHVIFGKTITSGAKALNPGLSRGVLHISLNEKEQTFEQNGIYVLPVTTSDLPRVSGILTAGEGNSLSHVQLLARNLGIPNVAIDPKLFDLLKPFDGKPVVLAVSQQGVVKLAEDSKQWDSVFAQKQEEPKSLIRPDMEKLDVGEKRFLSLAAMRSSDSGRVAGPKAANLGELKHHFPEAVTEGLVIPFGVFYDLMGQEFTPGGPSAIGWLKGQYEKMDSVRADDAKHQQVVEETLSAMQAWLLAVDPGDDFRRRLRSEMERVLGKDGNYGVFVRSDTNVEDLPGFTGAGLNKTVANVVGFENILSAIKRVWASPFAKRPFYWRQMHMEHPEDLYISVLLMKSVPVEKSGVLVTADLKTGSSDWLSVAINEGVGGAVAGQFAEEIRINGKDGSVVLQAQASEPQKRIVPLTGGVQKIAASGRNNVLTLAEITTLRTFARDIPERFPMLRDLKEQAVPADVEFGFLNNKLVLFQIRPFLNSTHARNSLFLNNMDSQLHKRANMWVDIRPDLSTNKEEELR